MVTYNNLIVYRVCGKTYPHIVPLFYHFDQIHGKKCYMLAIQGNGKLHINVFVYILFLFDTII